MHGLLLPLSPQGNDRNLCILPITPQIGPSRQQRPYFALVFRSTSKFMDHSLGQDSQVSQRYALEMVRVKRRYVHQSLYTRNIKVSHHMPLWGYNQTQLNLPRNLLTVG